MPIPNPHTSKRTNIALWTLQGGLAALFLFTGVLKLVMPIAVLTQSTPLPGLLIRCIAILEVLGAFGLILPGLLHFGPWLTPLAAAGLVIIMSGAFAVSLTTGHANTALLPVVVGLLLAIVAVIRGAALARVYGSAPPETSPTRAAGGPTTP